MFDTTGIERTIAYKRVSGRKQAVLGVSMETQEIDFVSWCQMMRLPSPIVREEVESASEAKEESRTTIKQLLKEVRKGDLVIVTKLDRWSRDTLFTISTVRSILKRGAKFWSISENFDASTPIGEATMTMLASMAKMERERIQQRTEGNRKWLRSHGKFVEGRPPFGYRRARGKDATDKPRKLEIDPVAAKVVREMFSLYLSGLSCVEVSEELRKRFPGAHAFGRAWVIRALKNRVYTGQLSTVAVRPNGHNGSGQLPGEWMYTHDPIIPMEEWQRAQKQLSERRVNGPEARDDSNTKDFLTRGLARCALCDTMVCVVPTSKTSRTKHKGHYVCRKRLTPGEDKIRCDRAPYYRQSELDAIVEAAMVARLGKARKELSAPPPRVPNAPDYGKQRTEIKAKRGRLIDALTEGKLSADDIGPRLKALDSELAAIDATEAEFNAKLGEDTIDNRLGAREWIANVADTWQTLPIGSKRAAIEAILVSIQIGPGVPPNITWADATTLATRFAEGYLPELATDEATAEKIGEVAIKRRRARWGTMARNPGLPSPPR